ncbi:MAG TPA: hypothetical protein VLQ93_22665 [Myxococcaceae bacterium]|nr:hypothetical protein [Myxococcaceae bacterium]
MKKPLKSLDSALPKVCLGALAATHLACATPQVRPTPPGEDCPADAMRVMLDEFNFAINQVHTAFFPFEVNKLVSLQEGLALMKTSGDWGNLPNDTSIVGRLYFSEGRVHGRFTEARLADGRRRPVCLELTDGYERGIAIRTIRGPDIVDVYPVADLHVVERFE